MSKGFNYSKWDNIELSDDEDDVHPNIERESWFRMKHRSRIEREEKEEIDKKKINTEITSTKLRMKEIEQLIEKLSKLKNEDTDDSDDELEDEEGLRAELEELRKKNEGYEKKVTDYEKNKKWNVDNICHVVDERTIVNPKATEVAYSNKGFLLPNDDKEDTKEENSKKSTKKSSNVQPSEENEAKIQTVQKQALPAEEPDVILSYPNFVEKYANVLEEWMTIRDFDKCKDFLLLHGNVLLQENASNYLLLASLEDEMNGHHDKMRLTARQSQILSNIAELAKSLNRHPGSVILPFFSRLHQKEFLQGFLEGVEGFIDKIMKRAVVKRKEMDAEAKAAASEGQEVDLESIPKEERLGPGGLDPVVVFESLPDAMKEAFESRNVDNLKAAIMKMDPNDAEYHMKLCVDSGLWNEG